MTDRELLELAAKAIGRAEAKFEDGEWLELRYGYKIAMWHDDFDNYWNPLESNADAFALAVKLRIHIEWAFTQHGEPEIVQASPKGRGHCADFQALGDKPYAATRRAITRAAAEIGKGMP